MRQFNLELLKEQKIAVNCKTESEAQEFSKWAINLDNNTNDGVFSNWGVYRKNTCLRLAFTDNKNVSYMWCDTMYYLQEGYKIISFNEALEN